MSTSKIVDQVVEQLQRVGWVPADLVREPLVSHAGHPSRPDIVLLFKGYPVAVVEIRHELAVATEVAEQVQDAANALGVQHVFFTDGLKIIERTKSGLEPRDCPRWPRPEELWISLGRQMSPDEPRIANLLPYTTSPPLHIATATARILDAVVQGRQKILVSMPQGTGKTAVVLEVMSRLLAAKRVRRVLCIAESRVLIEQLRHRFLHTVGNLYRVEEPPTLASTASIQLGTSRFFQTPWAAPRLQIFPNDTFDLIIFIDIPSWEARRAIAEHFTTAITLGFTAGLATSARQYFGDAVFTYSIEDAIRSEEIQPPEGYKAVRLGDLVEIAPGRSAAFSREEVADAEESQLLRGADLEYPLGIHFASMPRVWLRRQHREDALIRPGDIVLAAIGFPSTRRIAIVPSNAPAELVAAASVIRLRSHPKVNPALIVESLVSGVSRIALVGL